MEAVFDPLGRNVTFTPAKSAAFNLDLTKSYTSIAVFGGTVTVASGATGSYATAAIAVAGRTALLAIDELAESAVVNIGSIRSSASIASSIRSVEDNGSSSSCDSHCQSNNAAINAGLSGLGLAATIVGATFALPEVVMGATIVGVATGVIGIFRSLPGGT
jgi:hypothetical protein